MADTTERDQVNIRVKPEDRRRIDKIKRALGVQNDSEATRYAWKRAAARLPD